MNILVVNCGSSSLKFQLINSETEQVKASGNCERIGLDGNIIYKTGDKKTSLDVELKNHGVAIKKVLDIHTNCRIFYSLFKVVKKLLVRSQIRIPT